MFDCVLPTRLARAGIIFTRRGSFRITHRKFRKDRYPLDTGCSCYTCTTFSRLYVHHLVKSKEILGTQLIVLHNLTYYLDLMSDIRAAIESGTYQKFRRNFHETYTRDEKRGDLPPDMGA
jgi:queuine tRNA-ribosyltransferase